MMNNYDLLSSQDFNYLSYLHNHLVQLENDYNKSFPSDTKKTKKVKDRIEYCKMSINNLDISNLEIKELEKIAGYLDKTISLFLDQSPVETAYY